MQGGHRKFLRVMSKGGPLLAACHRRFSGQLSAQEGERAVGRKENVRQTQHASKKSAVKLRAGIVEVDFIEWAQRCINNGVKVYQLGVCFEAGSAA